MKKHVNLVDLVKSFPTNSYLQNLTSIQRRTSPIKFDHLAEKSGKGSISNLSTKAEAIERLKALEVVLSRRISAVAPAIETPLAKSLRNTQLIYEKATNAAAPLDRANFRRARSRLCRSQILRLICV